MISRALNSTNDIFLLNSQIARVQDGAQVVQNVRCRLLFYRGEAILDLSVGVPWIQSVLGAQGVRNRGLVDSLIKSEILQTDGVQELTSYSSEYDPVERQLNVAFTALTTYGTISDQLYINV